MALPQRPPELVFRSLCELYLHFQSLFLAGKSTGREFQSACGCRIMIFDHHFFHIVKLTRPGVARLFMSEEKTKILAQIVGFGDYAYDDNRARHLASAMDTLTNPDCVYRPEKLRTADRVFIREYDSSPYPYTAVFVGNRDGGFKVPVTAFPLKRPDLKKWTRGLKLFPKTHQPPHNGG